MKNIELQGNKGGDYIKIRQTNAQEKIDCINLEVGCSCVVMLRAQIPIEFLARLIMEFMVADEDGDSRNAGGKLKDYAKELFTYSDKEFVSERLSQIKEYNCWGEEKHKED